jgi:RNA polymerase sigma factor (sigma-70 family)
MATSQMSGVVKHLRRGAILGEGEGEGEGTTLGDGQLLECYITGADEAAFAALVRRHGPMVWGVCRRLLASHHDAEDAFQATFLVLARKAAAVMPRELVANWLYGVACNVAHKARALAVRRRTRERQVNAMPEPSVVESAVWRDLGPLLDHELSRLPDKYRVPVVLCDLEGKSYKEAARQVGCADGTLGARLSRARAILAQRLARHGVALSTGALALAMSQNAPSARVPAAVVSNTIKAAGSLAAGQAAAGAISARAAELSEGVIKTMLVKKLSYPLALLLAAAALLSGAGLLWYAGADAGSGHAPGQAALNAAKAHPAQGAGKKSDEERIVGTWRFASANLGGQPLREEVKVLARMTFTKEGKFTFSIVEKANEATFKIVGPGKIDLDFDKDQQTSPGIYQFDGDDKLTICIKEGGPDRPTKFEGDTMVLVRAKAGEEKPTAEELAKFKGATDKIRASASRAVITNNLKQIGLAIHNYEAAIQHLPLHAIYSKDGKTPLLSWRVAILPFLSQNDLYNQFKLDEAWDSAHNKKLIAKMPKIYGSFAEGPGKGDEGRTHFEVFTGPDSLFDGTKKMKLADITDGTSMTILVIEGKDAVTWTRPDDLVLPKVKEKMPEVGGQFKNGILVLLCDGSVHMLAAVPPPDVLRALVTPNGNEEIDFQNMKVIPKK